MAEVTSEAVIMFDVGGLEGTPSSGEKPNDDLTRAIKRQNDLTERANRLAEAQRTGSYTNPSTGATTTNKRVIDFLSDLERKASTPASGGFGGRTYLDAQQSLNPEWANNFNNEIKKTSDNISKMDKAIVGVSTAMVGAAFDIMKSTVGANSYDYENRKAEGEASALSKIGAEAGAAIGLAVGGPVGGAIGAITGEGIGSYFGKLNTVDTQANTQLRALSGLTGGYFGDYENLKQNLGSEQRAQDFLGVAKNVMAGTTGMAGLTGNAGVEFTKTFTNEFKNTLTGQEQASTANTVAALVSHSGIGKDSAATAKAVTELADIAKSSGVMPNILANTALNYQSATGSRDYNEALKFAQLSTTQGGSIAAMSQTAALSGATSTVQSELLLNTLGLSLDDIKSGNAAKIAAAVGKPTTGKRNARGEVDINENQLLFEAAGYQYKPYYNAAMTGTKMPEQEQKAAAEFANNTKDMTITAGTIYLSGNIITSGSSSTEGAMPTQQQRQPQQSATPKAPKPAIASFPDSGSDEIVPPIINPSRPRNKVTH